MITFIMDHATSEIHIKYMNLNRKTILSVCDKEFPKSTSTTLGLDAPAYFLCEKCRESEIKRFKLVFEKDVSFFSSANFKKVFNLRVRFKKGSKIAASNNYINRKMIYLKNKSSRKSKFHE